MIDNMLLGLLHNGYPKLYWKSDGEEDKKKVHLSYKVIVIFYSKTSKTNEKF